MKDFSKGSNFRFSNTHIASLYVVIDLVYLAAIVETAVVML